MRTIPEISDDRLKELASRITPLIEIKRQVRGNRKNRMFSRIEPVDLRTMSFLLCVQPGMDFRYILGPRYLTTFHDWGHYGMFKPSIAEVLAQIQNNEFLLGGEDNEPRVDAFCLLRNDGAELYNADEHNHNGYHRATVELLKIWRD